MDKASAKIEADTPMMTQYHAIKKGHPDSILFYRMGDFYEMFNEDAQIASKILQIALTARNKTRPNPTPMCGIPFHSANAYISKLIQAGRNVAICEQVEDPRQAKGLVKREVVRIVTPGTFLDDSNLDPKAPHNLASVVSEPDGFGLAILDMSTGAFKTSEFTGESAETLLIDELEKHDPREVVLPRSRIENNSERWAEPYAACMQGEEDWAFTRSDAYQRLTEHFHSNSLEGFGCEAFPKAICAAGGLLRYLQETQKNALPHIRSLSTYNPSQYMLLDQCTIRSLELVQSSEGSRKRSLLDALDQSQTPMGARRIREWILKPLIEAKAIQDRLDRVASFHADPMLRSDIRQSLKNIYDMERLLGRLSLTTGSPRDLISLKLSLAEFPKLQSILKQFSNESWDDWTGRWDNLSDLHKQIDRYIEDDPAPTLKDGGVIKTGCDKALDRLKTIKTEARTWIVALENQEKERTGISVLKVGYNKIYGYYIEITKKNLDRAPAEYIRKQSLVNAERFISPELKKFEEEISGAEEKIVA